MLNPRVRCLARVLLRVRQIPIGPTLVACLAITLWAVTFLFMSNVPLSGDEGAYNRDAEAIAKFLLSREDIPLSELAGRLVGRGWFMPGMSFVLTPLYAIDPAPSTELIRGYTTVVVFALWLWTLRELSVAFGRLAALVFLVFPTLAATWLMFTSTAWADLPAGLVLIVVGARTYRIAVRMFSDSAISIRDLMVLEALMIVMVYLRANLLAAVVAVHVFLAAVAVISGYRSRLVRRGAVLGIGVLVFTALLAPWSMTASREFGEPVVTAPKLPLSFAKAFGDRSVLCFGPCGEGNIHHAAWEFSRDYAARHGISEVRAQRLMAQHALRGLEASSYLAQVQENFASFMFQPSGFAARFVSTSLWDVDEGQREGILAGVRAVTLATYVPFLIALLLGNVVVVRGATRFQLLSLLVKMLTLCLFLQPFVHVSHARYWVGFAPVMGLAGFFVMRDVIGARWARSGGNVVDSGSWAEDGLENEGGNGVLSGIQYGYVVLFLGGALVVLVG